jgi:hypothetical protein
MSSSVSNYRRQSNDHFQPEADMDPATQRALRGKLEQIDYIAYISSREVIDHTLPGIDAVRFQKLAVAAAEARTQWVSLALALTESGHLPTAAQVESLTSLRTAYEELAAAYDGLRRMVERGYVSYHGTAAALSRG